jgi:hypothetical protein
LDLHDLFIKDFNDLHLLDLHGWFINDFHHFHLLNLYDLSCTFLHLLDTNISCSIGASVATTGDIKRSGCAVTAGAESIVMRPEPLQLSGETQYNPRGKEELELDATMEEADSGMPAPLTSSSSPLLSSSVSKGDREGDRGSAVTVISSCGLVSRGENKLIS